MAESQAMVARYQPSLWLDCRGGGSYNVALVKVRLLGRMRDFWYLDHFSVEGVNPSSMETSRICPWRHSFVPSLHEKGRKLGYNLPRIFLHESCQ